MLHRLFARIESAETAARLNVVGGWRSFARAATDLYEVRQLAALRSDQSCVSQVLMRLAELCELGVDPRFENPHDVAIASYLLVLSRADREVFVAAIEKAATARNCWWTTQIVEAAHASIVSASDNDSLGQLLEEQQQPAAVASTSRPIQATVDAMLPSGEIQAGVFVVSAGDITRTLLSGLTLSGVARLDVDPPARWAASSAQSGSDNVGEELVSAE